MAALLIALGAVSSATPPPGSPGADTHPHALLASEPAAPGQVPELSTELWDGSKAHPRKNCKQCSETERGWNCCRSSERAVNNRREEEDAQDEDSTKPKHCKVCSQDGGWNCCGFGGSWYKLCPKIHSWEEGHDVCDEQRLRWEKAERKKMNEDGSYMMSNWSNAHALDRLFKHGVPSNDLGEAGLLIHGFDGTENWAQQATWKGWFPCTTGFCENAAKWWSGSIINSDLRNSFGGAALILSPSENALLCSYSSDAGTLTSGCAKKGGGYWGPNETMGMLTAHTNHRGYGYNEVLIDMEVYVKNLPKSVAGIVYGLQEGTLPRDEIRAHQVYVRMLERYNLSEASFPLLKANYDPLGHEPIHGRAFTDMSANARDFLAGQKPLEEENPLKQENKIKQAEWDKAHPELKDHPERVYQWMRKRRQIEQRERRQTVARPFHDGTNGHDGAKELWISTTP